MPAIDKKEMIHTFLLVMGYGLFIYCLQLFLMKAVYISFVPDDTSLYRWDSGVYMSIAKNGYIDSNIGCYFLFPLVWRWLHVGVAGICIANYIFFGVGFSLLTQIYKITTTEKLVWLTTPMVYIMAIPYTESLFFLLMVALFYGILAKKRWIIWGSLFLASLTRATAIFLLPALLVMELISTHNKQWHKILLFYFIDYAIPILSGLILFICYQYYAVGVWFAYFIGQQKGEGHEYSNPIFPLSSMQGPKVLWICALAVFCCFTSTIVMVKKISLWVFKNVKERDKILTLSLVFLGITLYKTIFYNPKWDTGTTLTIGINRYVFATPFFFVFLYYFTNRATAYKGIHYLYAFIFCNIAWLSCGSYVHIQYFLFFNFMTLVVFAYMMLSDKKITWPALAVIITN